MAAAQRFTTDQVLAYLLEDDDTNENADRGEETFVDYLGVILEDSEDDRSGAVEVPSADSSDDNSSESDDERSNEEGKSTERNDVRGMQDVLHLAYPNPDNTESVLSLAEPNQDKSVNPWESSDTADSSGESDESVFSSNQVSSDDESEQELRMERDVMTGLATLSAGQECGRGRGRGRGRGCGRGQKHGRGWSRGRGRGHGRGQGRGRGRGHGRGIRRVRGQRGRSSCRGRVRGQSVPVDSNAPEECEDSDLVQDLRITSYKDLIPKEAVSIEQKDAAFVECSEFLPIREPGPHLPFPEQQHITELDLFGLYITDDMLEHFVDATNSYAESKKESKRSMYRQFKMVPLTKEELLRYLGILLLLSINSVRSYRQAWNRKSSQLLVRLHDLMSRNRFEAISAFFHVVTPDKESPNDPLKKIRSMHDGVKKGCAQYYQPLRELSVDERMVKSKARSHFRQYIRNKPTKWGFKYWVLADPTGYTLDFDLYCGGRRTTAISEHGLSYDVVMELTQMYQHQGYYLFIDNFYTSPALVKSLKEWDIGTTGTLRTNRRGIPESVLQLHTAMTRSDVPRGTGYYIRVGEEVYICWKDSSCVTLSNNYPGHTDGTVKRRTKNRSGEFESVEVPLPSAVNSYNTFMGGVDMSDQLISYHRIIRQTKKYWKTLFYHLLEISVTNAALLYNWIQMVAGNKKTSTNKFRDDLVLAIIAKHGLDRRSNQHCTPDYRISHGSTAIVGRKICVLCKKKASRNCPSCPFMPTLCQSTRRDCHGKWHSDSMMAERKLWFMRQQNRLHGHILPSKRPGGRPKGSKDRKKRVVH